MYTYKVYVPSYMRHDNIVTEKLFEECTYVVRKSEEELYKKAGVKNILAVQDDLIDSQLKVMDWIIKNAEEDILVVCDDDIEDIAYRLDDNVMLHQNKEIITAEMERISQLMLDLNVGFACTDATPRPFGYDREFAFKGISGGLKWFNRKVFKAKLDVDVTWNFDVDIVLQELMFNRIILKPKYICDIGQADVNKGGSQSDKTRQKQIDSIENMKRKWGKYFKYNYKTNVPTVNVKR